MNPWKALAFVFACMLAVQSIDYHVARAGAAEKAETARRAEANRARIWSKRCERQGKQILATKADGEGWKIKCVNANIRT